jgi:hypothetical protein
MSFSHTELDAALKAAIAQCESLGVPLSSEQQQVLRLILTSYCNGAEVLNSVASDVLANGQAASDGANAASEPMLENDGANATAGNPLDEMSPEHRQLFLDFIRSHSVDAESWKTGLLNDWLSGNQSGDLQFIRDCYGPQWLSRVQPIHLTKYLEPADLALKVGDRIQVTNGLWEWVQDDGPCQREWFDCVVVAVKAVHDDALTTPDSYRQSTTCVIRFDSGREFEIQGIYEWNRYNWRWPGEN